MHYVLTYAVHNKLQTIDLFEASCHHERQTTIFYSILYTHTYSFYSNRPWPREVNFLYNNRP